LIYCGSSSKQAISVQHKISAYPCIKKFHWPSTDKCLPSSKRHTEQNFYILNRSKRKNKKEDVECHPRCLRVDSCLPLHHSFLPVGGPGPRQCVWAGDHHDCRCWHSDFTCAGSYAHSHIVLVTQTLCLFCVLPAPRAPLPPQCIHANFIYG
jgi:hypothetical protein